MIEWRGSVASNRCCASGFGGSVDGNSIDLANSTQRVQIALLAGLRIARPNVGDAADEFVREIRQPLSPNVLQMSPIPVRLDGNAQAKRSGHTRLASPSDHAAFADSQFGERDRARVGC